MGMITKLVLISGLLVASNCFALEWECIEKLKFSWEYCDTKRTKIPKGWLVRYSFVRGGGLTFVPDPKHEWKV